MIIFLAKPGGINFQDVLMKSLEQVNELDRQSQSMIAGRSRLCRVTACSSRTGDLVTLQRTFSTSASRRSPHSAMATLPLRKVAAAARDLLVEKAAKQWNVAAEKLVAGDGKVTDPASGKSVRYAELAREDIGAQKPPAEDPIKPASQWTIAGKPVPKVDAREFVTGGHRYTTDRRPEGMLHEMSHTLGAVNSTAPHATLLNTTAIDRKRFIITRSSG